MSEIWALKTVRDWEMLGHKVFSGRLIQYGSGIPFILLSLIFLVELVEAENQKLLTISFLPVNVLTWRQNEYQSKECRFSWPSAGMLKNISTEKEKP